MTPEDEAVAALHPDLPLELALDDAALSAALGADAAVDRIRLKPGASLRASVRTAEGWHLLRGYRSGTAGSKARKDRRHAEAAGLPVRVLEGPSGAGCLLLPASADRDLPDLAELRPDTGLPGSTPYGSSTGARTLSYNPGRRWVGRVVLPGGERVLRLHADRPAELTPWVAGRAWSPQDGPPDVAGELAARPPVTGAGPRGQEGRAPAAALAPALAAAVKGLVAVDPARGRRAHEVLRRTTALLDPTATALAHGDLSPDQLVVDVTGRVHVLDWDREGLWPLGWDAASWRVSLVAHPALAGGGTPAAATAGASAGTPLRSAGPPPGLVAPGPGVLAAAALLRCPEPFRRRRPGWGAAVDDLLDLADGSFSDGSPVDGSLVDGSLPDGRQVEGPPPARVPAGRVR